MTQTNEVAARHGRGRRRVLAAVGVGFLVVFLTSSIKNVIPAYLIPMAGYFAVSPATIAIGPTTFMIVYGLVSPVIGVAADRLGARNTITLGLLLAGVCFLVSSAVPTFGVFAVLYGFGASTAFVSVSYIPLGVLVDELFPPGRRGFSYALLTNGTAVGFMLLSPAWVLLSQSVTWRIVFAVLGLVFLVPLALANHVVVPARDASAAAPAGPRVPVRARLRAVLRIPGFWVLSASFFGCGVTMGFIDVHVVSYMQSMDDSPAVISSAMIVLGVAEFAGGLLAGRLCDRMGGRWVLVGAYFLRSLSLVVLAAVPSAAGSVVFTAIFGISYMGSVIATTLYALDIFDPGTRGLALGMIWFVHQLGSGLTSEGGAVILTAFGSYLPAVLGAAAISLVSFLITLFVEPRRPRDPRTAPAEPVEIA